MEIEIGSRKDKKSVEGGNIERDIVGVSKALLARAGKGGLTDNCPTIP